LNLSAGLICVNEEAAFVIGFLNNGYARITRIMAGKVKV
jgi:hypothetical protein